MRTERGARQRQAQPIRCKGEIAGLESTPQGSSLLTLLKVCRREELGLLEAAFLRVAYDTGARRPELAITALAKS